MSYDSSQNTAIFGSCYVATQQRQCEVYLWAKLTQKLNPKHKILLVDSASPNNPAEFLSDLGFKEDPASQYEVYRYPENVGHLSMGGKDGWGRAFCDGIDMLRIRGYKYVAYIDADIIFTNPVDEYIEKMDRIGVKIACPMDLTYHFAESGITFINTDYMYDINFREQYNWETPNSEIPEIRCARIWKDDLFLFDFVGFRNDFDQINHQNIGMPSLTFLTHCKDFSLYPHFLDVKGIVL